MPESDHSHFIVWNKSVAVFNKGNLFLKRVSCFHKVSRKIVCQGRMNIRFVGRCLSWPQASHNFSLTLLHSCWMGILFYFIFLFILWMALRLRFCISITKGSEVTGKAWAGTPHTFLLLSPSNQEFSNFPLSMWWRMRAIYPDNLCVFIVASQMCDWDNDQKRRERE